MMEQEYSEATREIARLDSEINRCCIAHDTPGAMKALTARRALEATVKAAVVGVAILALSASAAFAATASHGTLVKAQPLAVAALDGVLEKAQANAQTLQYMTVTCAGSTKRIVCTGRGPGAVSGGSNTGLLGRATFAVSGGTPRLVKVTVAKGVGAV